MNDCIALLRGINVGGQRKIEMKRLKQLMSRLGYENISTYLNSGNVIFSADDDLATIRSTIEDAIRIEFGFEVITLIKTAEEMAVIAAAIPDDWQNDGQQKTDVAYLFPEADTDAIIGQIPIRKEYVDIRYIRGAIIWNVDRSLYNKSHLNKILAHPVYQQMTIRNVNTARFLGRIPIR